MTNYHKIVQMMPIFFACFESVSEPKLVHCRMIPPPKNRTFNLESSVRYDDLEAFEPLCSSLNPVFGSEIRIH